MNKSLKLEDHSKLLISLADDLYCISNSSGYFIDVNHKWTSLLGYSREELLSKPFIEFVHPDDREKTRDRITRMNNDNLAKSFKNRYVDSKGCIHWIEWKSVSQDNKSVTLGIGKDITKFIEEEKLNEISQQIARMGSWQLNLESNYLSWSDVTYQIHELAVGSPLNVEEAINYYIEEHREVINKSVELAITTGQGWDEELQIITAKNNILWVRAIGRVIYKAGKPVALEGVFQDIDEKKKQDMKLEQALRAKETFLATMSHEMRTPLNGISGVTQLIKTTSLSGEQQSLVKLLDAGCEDLLVIIDDILDYGKIYNENFELNLSEFNLHELICDVFRNQSIRNKDSEIEFSLSIDENYPALIESEKSRLRQIVNNLINNSFKFTKSGKISVHMGSYQYSQDKVEFKIKVKDTGVGISRDQIKNVFQAFYQVESGNERCYEGMGLGLAICKQLARKLNGDLEVSSQLGVGSEFTLKVKAAFNNELKIEATIEEQLEGQPLHILIVEDNAINRTVTTKFLDKIGYTYDLAFNGEEAISKYQKGSFDVVLMDIQMPVMDGITASKVLIENNTKKPYIVALTASAFQKDIEMYYNIGMSGFLAKPLNFSLLKKEFNKYKSLVEK